VSSSGGKHRITHMGLCVRSIERSTTFYERALGFEEVGRMRADGPETATLLDVADASVELVYLERDGLRIELLGFDGEVEDGGNPRRVDRTGFTHLSIRVDAVDDLVPAIEAHGGRVLRESAVRFEWGNQGLMVLDPDGIRIELIERRAT
jgi:glyoxylase I family protein